MSQANISLRLIGRRAGRNFVSTDAVVGTNVKFSGERESTIETTTVSEVKINLSSGEGRNGTFILDNRHQGTDVVADLRALGAALMAYADDLAGFSVKAPTPVAEVVNEAAVLRSVADRIETQDEDDNTCPVHGGEWGDAPCFDCTGNDYPSHPHRRLI